MSPSTLGEARLEEQLALLLGGAVVVERAANPNSSTFASETVTCLVEGQPLRLHCKRSTGGETHTAHGHRGDLAREIVVYRDLLGTIGPGTPRYVGSLEDDGGSLLAIEHVDGASRLDAAPAPEAALVAAATWAGAFHRAAASSVDRAQDVGLPRYDARYYASWVLRTWELAKPWRARLPWLRPLCEQAGAIGSLLAETGTDTVVHGELTPHNVLVRDEEIVPVDWESAAVAFGEIDLAALVDKWPEHVQRSCVAAYAAARSPDAPSARFERRVDLGRLYWDFRWLGDRPEWTASEQVGPRFAHLETVARRLSLLGTEQ